jgi:hypothetical protein
MMSSVKRDPKQFGQLLKMAVRRIALQESKKVAIVQDELGYALGRDSGGVAIQFWERGNIPARREEVQLLKEELVRRQGLAGEDGGRFVRYAGFPELEQKPSQPFVAGPPITDPRLFFGRTYELRRLFALWDDPALPLQNAAIIGPRGSGKTSLLFYLMSITHTAPAQLRPDQRNKGLGRVEAIRWVYVDFRNPQFGTRTGLLRHFLVTLELPVPTPCDLEHFVESMVKHLHDPAVILLDEIDVALERHAELDDPFWDGLRALASTQLNGQLGFVLAARELPQQVARRHHRSSDFFSIFAYTAPLGPLTEPEAHALIATSPIRFTDEEIDWMMTQSRGWPLLLQILCRECLLVRHERATGKEWRDAALQQLIPFQHLLATQQP